MAILHACNFPTWVIVYNILPCSACAGPANGDGSGESRLHGEERGGDVGKKLDKFPHACMHAYFSEVGNTSTHGMHVYFCRRLMKKMNQQRRL